LGDHGENQRKTATGKKTTTTSTRLRVQKRSAWGAQTREFVWVVANKVQSEIWGNGRKRGRNEGRDRVDRFSKGSKPKDLGGAGAGPCGNRKGSMEWSDTRSKKEDE